MSVLPSIFISHGAPTIALKESPVRTFWRTLLTGVGRPNAILCVSAHWETDTPSVSLAERPETIHDFYGFPDALYELAYPAPGAPDLARRVVSLLSPAGFPCVEEPERGLDHGAWIPLMEMLPDADIPVTQLSIQSKKDMGYHLELGRALAPLRQEGILVLASGGAVHNLGAFQMEGSHVPDWARRFDAEIARAVEEGDELALVHYRTEDGAKAHPRDEHFLPLGVAFGAGGVGATGKVLHRGFMDGAIGTAAYAFG